MDARYSSPITRDTKTEKNTWIGWCRLHPRNWSGSCSGKRVYFENLNIRTLFKLVPASLRPAAKILCIQRKLWQFWWGYGIRKQIDVITTSTSEELMQVENLQRCLESAQRRIQLSRNILIQIFGLWFSYRTNYTTVTPRYTWGWLFHEASILNDHLNDISARL